GRAATDGFLAWAGIVTGATTTLASCPQPALLMLATAVNGETIFPATAQLTVNGVPVALPALPAHGWLFVPIALASGSNTLQGSLDGTVPGTKRTVTDSDKLVIKCP